VKLQVALFDHQKEALSRLKQNRHYALFMEQGTGKTLPTLNHILDLLIGGEIEDALIICPLAVKESWYRDMDLFTTFYRSILKKRVTVVNYDIVWRRTEYMRPWGCVVLDESHFIKNRGSHRAKYCRQLGKKAKYRYILTGTPIGNSQWHEIWAQYDFLDPGIFGTYSQFEKRYCILDQYFKPKAYNRTEEIEAKIATVAYRVKKNECTDLPEKLPPESLVIELQERKLYKEMLENYIAELDIEAPNPLARMVKLRSLCSGFIKDETGQVHQVKSGKPGALRDLLDNWNKKLVIFAEFRESIRVIKETLDDLKIRYVVLDGDQKDKTVWKRFQSEPGIQVIVCQYRTASAGIDLYSADTMLFYEPTLSSQINEQAMDRIHRTGQRQVCSYLYLITKGTVEVKIYHALAKHADFSENLLREYVEETRSGKRLDL
jgi:SNF2 family DNA or RNA helicase